MPGVDRVLEFISHPPGDVRIAKARLIYEVCIPFLPLCRHQRYPHLPPSTVPSFSRKACLIWTNFIDQCFRSWQLLPPPRRLLTLVLPRFENPLIGENRRSVAFARLDWECSRVSGEAPLGG